MGTLLNKVVDVGRAAATGANRLYNIPGNVGRMGTDVLENATYGHLMKNAGDKTERLAYQQMAQAGMPGTSQVARQANQQILGQLKDSTFQNLEAKARSQAALVPGGLRLAGRAATSPLAMTAAGVGGTLAVGNMMEEQALREQLQSMGLSPEEAEILRNEMAQAAMQMEPMEGYM
jgi:hypothetical protein